MPSATKDPKDAQQTGYAEVVALEQKEEERVKSALAAIAEEDQKVRNEFADQLRQTEMKTKTDANEELKEYKDKELARILHEGEEHTVAARMEIESHYKKHAPAAVKTLVEKSLDPSLLS
jgi:hypothetical protein